MDSTVDRFIQQEVHYTKLINKKIIEFQENYSGHVFIYNLLKTLHLKTVTTLLLTSRKQGEYKRLHQPDRYKHSQAF